jgi:hypothetical protein
MLNKGGEPMPAESRRSSPKAPLLPSGPDGLTNISSRGDQHRSTIETVILCVFDFFCHDFLVLKVIFKIKYM